MRVEGYCYPPVSRLACNCRRTLRKWRRLFGRVALGAPPAGDRRNIAVIVMLALMRRFGRRSLSQGIGEERHAQYPDIFKGIADWESGANWSANSPPGTLDTALFNSVSDATLTNVEYENIGTLNTDPGRSGSRHSGRTYDRRRAPPQQPEYDRCLGGNVEDRRRRADRGSVRHGSVRRLFISTNQGTYQWNGSGSTQKVDMGHNANDTFQFSTAFGGTISSFFAGDISSPTAAQP